MRSKNDNDKKSFSKLSSPYSVMVKDVIENSRTVKVLERNNKKKSVKIVIYVIKSEINISHVFISDIFVYFVIMTKPKRVVV